MSAPRKREYGVLLPQFGSAASRERLVDRCRDIEEMGFDSVWVRDHIVYEPHIHEDPDRTHVDPFVVLSAVAAVTDRIKLGTGVLIPHRHPIHTALLVGSLDFLAPGRVHAGIGVGTYGHEFDAIGIGGWDRRELVREQVEIIRALWGGEPVDHDGKYYSFESVDIKPVPGSDGVPIWYGGNSAAAVRRAVEYCDGWMPGRMPRRVFLERVERMERLAEKNGRADLPRIGTIPYVSPGRTVEEGMKYLNLEQLIDATNRMNQSKTAARIAGPEDLGGVAAVGPPDVIIEEIRKDQEAGADLVVFDLRPRFQDYEDMLTLIGEEVLPRLRGGDQ